MYKYISCIIVLSIGLSSNLWAETKDKGGDAVPKEMEQYYDDLFIDWKNSLNFNDCTSASDDIVKFSDSVYIDRLYSLPTEMELSFNTHVKSFIEMYAGRRRNQVSYMLAEGHYYFPLFENILDEAEIPLELKYLPVIESALNPIARSRMGATGLWQFMAATGRMYGLEINSLVDERRDPEKSTRAAAQYLKDMYSIYDDWNLVIAAYNCGPGNVNKAIRRSGGKRDFWEIYPYLPRETRGYVPIFIAATYIMNYYEQHGICPATPEKPASLDTLHIDKNIHFSQIEGVLGVDVADIRKYNPQFKSDIIPGEYKYYVLNLPFKEIGSFISNEDSILSYRTDELLSHRKTVGVGGGKVGTSSQSMVHRVKRGDTLSGIAQRYGVGVSQLKNWNNLRSDRLTIGHRLSIYKKVVTPSIELSQAEKKTTSKDGAYEIVTTTEKYRVKSGDSWGRIAQNHKTTVSQLKKWNNTNSNHLVAGQYVNIQKTKRVEIEVPKKEILPELMTVELDTDFIPEVIDQYLSNLTRQPLDLSNIPSLSGKMKEEERLVVDDSRTFYHKVKVGENINQIATRYKVTRDDIIEWNHLPNTSARIGQRLLIYLPDSSEIAEMLR